MEALITTVPSDILITLWSEWIEIADVATSDSAISSNFARVVFLDIVGDSKFVHHTKFASSSAHYHNWLVLRRLRLKNINVDYGSLDLDIPQFSGYFHNLKSLDSLKISGLSVNGFLNKGEEFDCQIKSLDILDNCSVSQDDLFLTTLKNLKLDKLAELSISHRMEFTDESVDLLLECCPNLTSLNFSCEDVSLNSIAAMVQLYSEKLVSLVVDFIDQIESFEDEAIKLIATHCPNLTHLDLSMWYCLQDEGIKQLSKGCNQLKYFNASHCDQITSDAIEQLIKSNINLTSFDVSESAIQDSVLIALGNNCPRLESVNIDSCDEITVFGFMYMVARCPLLRTVHVINIPLTDIAILTLVKCCPLLTSFHANRTFTEIGINDIIDHCKHLTLVRLSETQLTVSGLVRALRDANKLTLQVREYIFGPHLRFKRTETRKEVMFYQQRDMRELFTHWETIRFLCPDCDTIELSGFRNRFMPDIREIITPKLTSLTLHTMRYDYSAAFWSDIDNLLRCFAEQKTVTKFSMINCTPVNVALLFSELNVSDFTLTHLYMTNVTDFTPDTVKLILSKYPILKVLELRGRGSGFDSSLDGKCLSEYLAQGVRVIIKANEKILHENTVNEMIAGNAGSDSYGESGSDFDDHTETSNSFLDDDDDEDDSSDDSDDSEEDSVTSI